MPKKRHYWLMKSEPHVYSIDDLERDGSTCWEGVRNYQARNYMRDNMKEGDLVLFYHSNARPPGVAGIARVCKEAYPDFTAFDKRSEYFDPKSSKDNPIWYMVDVEFEEKFKHFITLSELRQTPGLEKMKVLEKFQRLSVQPVEAGHFNVIRKLGRGAE
jgi:predicted RNA-binding protein with PUA-like domain